MADVKEVGRVGIRVIPNAGKFRPDLLKIVRRAEQQVQFNLAIEPQFEKAQRSIDRFVDQMSDKDVNLAVIAGTAIAATEIARVARDRVVTLHAKVSGASLKAVGATFARLSGARLLGDYVERFGRGLANLDRSLPKIASVATGIASLSAVALNAGAGLFNMGAGLATALLAGAALPGIMAGAAIGVGTLMAALKDAPTVLAGLGPRFAALQDQISAKFWETAAAPIRSLVTSLLPSLSAGLSAVGGSLGSWASSLASSMQSALLEGGALDGILANVASSIDIASGAIQPFMQGMVALVSVGAAYLPQLAQWFGDISARLGTFLSQAATDGSLQAWITAGVQQLQFLGQSLASIGSILSGIANAAAAAGGGGLAGFASVLARIAEVVNGPAFQGALTIVFQGAASAASTLAMVLQPIGSMFVALAPTISTVMQTAATALTTLGSALAGALANPAFATGLTALFDGIAAAVTGLAPAMGPLAAVFGQLGQFAGALAAQLGPILGTAIQALAPVVTSLLAALQPVLPILGDALIGILTTLIPPIAQLAQTLFPVLGQIIAQLVPVVLPLVDALMPLVSAILPPLMSIITALLPVISALMPIFELLAPLVELVALPLQLLAPVLQILAPIIQIVALALSILLAPLGLLADGISWLVEMAQGALAPMLVEMQGWFTDVGTNLAGLQANWDRIWAAVSAVFTQIVGGIVSTVQSRFGQFRSIIESIVGAVQGRWNAFWNGLSSTVSTIVSTITGAVQGFGGNVRSAFDGVMSFLGSIPDRIRGFFSGIGSWLVNSGKSLIDGFISGIRSMIGAVTNAVGGIMDAVGNFFPHSPAKTGRFSGKGYTTYSGAALIEDWAGGIRSRLSDVRAAADEATSVASAGLTNTGSASIQATAPSPTGGDGRATINIYDVDGVLIGTMEGVVADAERSVATRARAGRK